MKLLIYAHDWAPTTGGIQTITLHLAEQLARIRHGDDAGFEVTLVTPTPAGDMEDAALPFRVVRRPSLGNLFHEVRCADVVHLAGPCLLPLAIAHLLRKPFVIEHHGFQSVCPNGHLVHQPDAAPCPGHFMMGNHLECIRCNAVDGIFRSTKMWLLTFARRFLSRRAGANITPTNWLAATLDLPHARTIYHGVPSLAVLQTATPSGAPPTFAFQGRLVGVKGVGLLLQAASQLKSMKLAFRLRIIGDGPDRVALEAMARNLGLDDCVQFVGLVPYASLGSASEGVSVIVIPSLGGETFGLVAAENMRRGLAVIVPAGGVLAEVAGDAALTFATGNAHSLAEAMRQFIEHPELTRILGARAISRATTLFEEREMVERHAQLYEQMAGAASRDAALE